MGKCCINAFGIGLGCALVVLHVYKMMPGRGQREIENNMKEASKRIKEVADETAKMVDAVLE